MNKIPFQLASFRFSISVWCRLIVQAGKNVPPGFRCRAWHPAEAGLNNLLSTPVAGFTYAQIVDGMPVSSVYAEDHWFREDFPVMQHHKLRPGTLEKTRAFRSDFNYSSLRVDSKVSKCGLSIPPHYYMCIL